MRPEVWVVEEGRLDVSLVSTCTGEQKTPVILHGLWDKHLHAVDYAHDVARQFGPLAQGSRAAAYWQAKDGRFVGVRLEPIR